MLCYTVLNWVDISPIPSTVKRISVGMTTSQNNQHQIPYYKLIADDYDSPNQVINIHRKEDT